MDISSEINKIKYIVEDESNIDYGSIDSQSRKQEYVRARMVLGNFLLYEVGLSHETLTKYIKRDRTNFYHYGLKHEGYMSNPRIYPEYYQLYNRVKEVYFDNPEALFDGQSKHEKLIELQKVEVDLLTLRRKQKHLQSEINALS